MPRFRRRAASGSRSAMASSTRSIIPASTAPARATWDCWSPVPAAGSPRRSVTPRMPSSRSRTACPPTGWSTRRRVTGSKSASWRIRRARPCCRKSASRHSRAWPRTTASTPCWRRIWSMPAWATPPGSACTRASRCCLRPGTAPAWRLPPRCPGATARPAMQAFPTAGSNSAAPAGSIRPAKGRRTAMSR